MRGAIDLMDVRRDRIVRETRARTPAEYMKRMGLTTADDFKETWAKAKVERERYYQQGGSVRKQDIREAIERLQSKR